MFSSLTWALLVALGIIVALQLLSRRLTSGVPELSAREALTRQQAGARLIDVRQPHEFAQGHARGAQSIPLGQLAQGAANLPKEQPLLIICASGNRSRMGASHLIRLGFQSVYSVQGGTQAWQADNLPMG